MQDKHLFEYAVIRVVPKVEREEFINVGVILYSRKEQFLKAMFTLDDVRLSAFSRHIDVGQLNAYLCTFVNICSGNAGSGPIGMLDIASRFRWLTATRSTVLQTSKVHPGLCEDAAEMLERLHTQLVLDL